MEQQQPNPDFQPEQQFNKPPSQTWKIVAIVAIIILVLVIISFAAYYLWPKQTGNLGQRACTMEALQCADGSYVSRTGPNCEFAQCPSVSPSVSPSASATPSATPDQTADWQTYINTQNGYSIRYPEKYFVRLICLGEELTLIKRETNDIRNDVNMEACARGGRYKFEIVTSAKVFSLPQSYEYNRVTNKPVKIDNKVGVKYTVEQIKEYPGPSMAVGEKEYYIYINSDGKYFEIYFGGKDLSEYLDQILSTFKFTK